MKKKVAIIGIGQTPCTKSLKELSHMELLYQATRAALKDASLSRDDIGSAFTTSYDLLEGRSLSNQYTLDSIGGVMKPCDLRLGEDGLYGVVAGFMEVLADPDQIIVVGSVQKGSERKDDLFATQRLVLSSLDPIYTRPVLSLPAESIQIEYLVAALEARRYMSLYWITEEQIAKVAVKNLNNATLNPMAQNRMKVTLEDVLSSEVLCWPLREMDVADTSDGACVLILASAERAKEVKQTPVWILGVGWCSDSSSLTKGELGKATYTYKAARQAYDMAGLKDPPKEVHLAEVYDAYSFKELQHCEALGLCEEGGAGRMIDEGISEINGSLPVNPSGGLLGHGNPIGTAGLLRVAQAALQVRVEAGGHQVPNPEVALAQAWGGIGTRCGGVVVLARD